jgi:hypothetical protein
VYTCKIKRFLVYPINLLSPKEEKQYVEICLLLPFNTTQQTVPYLHPRVPKQRSVGARMVRTKNYTKELETRKNLADPINIGPDFKKKERKKSILFPIEGITQPPFIFTFFEPPFVVQCLIDEMKRRRVHSSTSRLSYHRE